MFHPKRHAKEVLALTDRDMTNAASPEGTKLSAAKLEALAAVFDDEPICTKSHRSLHRSVKLAMKSMKNSKRGGAKGIAKATPKKVAKAPPKTNTKKPAMKACMHVPLSCTPTTKCLIQLWLYMYYVCMCLCILRRCLLPNSLYCPAACVYILCVFAIVHIALSSPASM